MKTLASRHHLWHQIDENVIQEQTSLNLHLNAPTLTQSNIFQNLTLWKCQWILTHSKGETHSKHLYSVSLTFSPLLQPTVPVPLWCRVESTGQVSRSEAAGAAPLLDARFQHLGCIHPQFFWTDCRYNVAQVTEESHTNQRTFVTLCTFV